MEKAIVLGATGGMGYALVNELTSQGIQVTAFSRSVEKLQKRFGGQSLVSMCPGNAFSLKELNDAVKGNDVIFHAINLPYNRWKKDLPTLTNNIIAATKDTSTRLAVVENIYSYGRSSGKKVKETMPKRPHTRKGKIRLEAELLYKESGIPYMIAYFPDFYGPFAPNSLLYFTLEKMVKNKKAQFVGDPSIAREHIYTLDGAKALVELAKNEKAYYQHWNIPAANVITGQEIIRIIRKLTNNKKKVSTVTKNMLRFAGLFNKQMYELVEMQYLNEDPVILSGEKYERKIGPLPKTSYEEGINATIKTIV